MLRIVSALVSAASFLSVTKAYQFYVNKGYVLVNGLTCCHGDVGAPTIVNGMISVEACLDSNNNPHCSLNVNVGAGYGELYWGADNCLYNDGATKKYGFATSAN